MRGKHWHQFVDDQVARAIDTALSVGVLDAHTARRVDENRHHHIVHPVVAPADRTQQEEHQQRKGDEPQRDQRIPAPGRNRKARVREPGNTRDDDKDDQERPRGKRIREGHRRHSYGFFFASDSKYFAIS